MSILKPCRRKKPFPLYHWAPSSRRRSIQRHGLVIGKRHVTHSGGWRASYLCFSDSPSYAWALSGDTVRHVQEWDLWMVWSADVPSLGYRDDHIAQVPAEYRTKHAVARKDLWLVGSRKRRIR